MWSAFQIDWRLFTYFKRNFWEVDVNLDEPLLNVSNEENVSAEVASPKERRTTRKVRRT
jgi:hypothetical protein